METTVDKNSFACFSFQMFHVLDHFYSASAADALIDVCAQMEILIA